MALDKKSLAKRRVTLLLWLLVSLHTAGALAGAGGLPEAALRVCYFDWKPYSFERDGRLQGIWVDLLNLMAWPQPLQFNFMPLPRCLAEVRQGKQDIVLYVGTQYPELRRSSVAVQYLISGMVVENGSSRQRLDSLREMAGERVGILRGSSLVDMLRSNFPELNWQEQNSGDSLWQMLLAKRLDGAMGDYPSLTALPVYRNGKVRFLLPSIHSGPLHMAVHHERQALLVSINRQLQVLLQNGTVDQLYRDYGAQPLSSLRQFVSEGCLGRGAPIPEC